ncbi:MAG: DNA polymerase III subunit delta [Rickettsiaceae bacterium]
MKFFASDLPKLIKLIEKKEIISLVLHGPNQGFISTAINQIVKKLNYSVINYSAKDLSANKLSLISNSQNFFNQKELVKIGCINSSINKEVKEFLTKGNFSNLICFVADDSLPPSGIRKFFEEQPHLAVLACYYDNEQTIAKLILQQCQKRLKNIDEDALFHLKSHLKGDHQVIRSELEKLFYYTHDKQVIEKADVIASLGSDLLASGDDMCVFFAKKEHLKFLKEVEKLKQQNINEVLMIRALIRYFLNIYFVSLRIEDGENIDRAIKSITPPIFYKYVDDFKQVVRKYNCQDAIKKIQALQKAEVSFKTNPNSFDLFSTLLEDSTT